MVDLQACGTCCAGFSLFSIVFLVLVGIVIEGGSDSIAVANESDRAAYASTCYSAAGIYAGCIVLSAICYFVGKKRADEEHMQLVARAHEI